jgi:hypothetical protein
MKQSKAGSVPSKKAHRDLKAHGRAAKSSANERQEKRQNQSGGRGSGEGKSGLQRGDGHPTGR